MELRLNGEAVPKLCQYCEQLLKWNRSINLIAAAPLRQVIETHFLDSLTLLPFFLADSAPRELMDVGSGAGFPGLVLKIACPELKVSLVEPRHKRVSFLRQIIRSLALQEVTVYADRLERGTNILAGEQRLFPCLTSRAFASVSDFLALAEPYTAQGAQVICMKGPNIQEELRLWESQSPRSSFTVQNVHNWLLPFSQAQRSLVIFEKKAS